ncbi:5-methylcytosine rRNA methyltransferase NSUN4-like [Littorina saxatilis]|uniref:NOL1/NOP2/Sun domain family member 4 n=1 Tax=Littorina saxatilis TaxID=31220 RepID=A0AAN9BLP6_9CAEN
MAALAANVSSILKTVNTAHRSLRCCLALQKRYRYKKKWAVNLASKTNCELALDHFDAFYKPLFGRQWPSIRVSLLSLNKYAAIINNASDAEIWSQNLAELGTRDLIRDAAKTVHKTILKENAKNAPQTMIPEQDERNVILDVEPSSESDTTSLESKEAGLTESSSSGLSQTTMNKKQTEPEHHTSNMDVGYSEERKDLDGMGNILTPDAMYNSTDLQHFMPTQQVFSEREELRQAEFSQSTYQERPVSVSVLPGQHPSLPLSLRVMAFPRGDVSDFPMPKADAANLLNYYLLDGASILPVLALDLRPHDNVLDLCAAPGGKTLAMLQIIISQGGHLTSNDVSQSRLRRLKTVLKSYFPQDLLSEFATVTERTGLSFSNSVFSKVLVDVPCNTDRHVLLEDENNLFKPGRTKERLQMTTLQKDLLLAGIRSCKPGGSVVYSTCTLAAVQNDGVVQAAVEELWETSTIDVAVEDLSPLKEAFSSTFKFHSGTRLGQLVLPSLTSNFGPMYFCKLRRLQ